LDKDFFDLFVLNIIGLGRLLAEFAELLELRKFWVERLLGLLRTINWFDLLLGFLFK
jgi:hypothetical protein